MKVTKQQIEEIVRSRIPIAIKNKNGNFTFPFKSVKMFNQTVECLTNGLHEELTKISKNEKQN